MSINMRSAAQVGPKVVYSNYVPTTGAPLYQPGIDNGAQIMSLTLHNQDTSTRTVIVAVVPFGSSAASANEITYSLTAGQTIELGEKVLGGGDFIWAQASIASKIVLTITALEFSDSVGAVTPGIRIDATGTGGYGAAGTASGTQKVGTLPNRRLVAEMMVIETGTAVGWTSYTGGGPTLACSDGPMTRKSSVDFNNGASIQGSVHIFTYDNPTSGSPQTLAAAAAVAGGTMGVMIASRCYSGVDLTAGIGAVSTGPTGAATLSLPFTMGAGDVPIMALAAQGPPQGVNMDAIRFDGVPSGFSIPQWLLMCDKFGLSALTAVLSNSIAHCAAGIVLKAA